MQPRSWSKSFNVSTPTIIYEELPVSLGGIGYKPPNSGHPIGAGVGQLGQWSDLRYPWRSASPNYPGLDATVDGPGSLMLWASVYQTNTRSRPLPVFGEGPALFPWSILQAFFAKARFVRVAGELSVDLEKMDDDCAVNEPCGQRVVAAVETGG
jgi:hypothetical protein